MFKTPNGTVSFPRISGYTALVAYLIAMLWVAFTTDKVIDIPPMAAGLITALYGIGKFASIAKGKNEDKTTN